MIARLMTTAAIVGTVTLAPTDRAEANDFIAGAAVGVLGTLAVQEVNRNRQQQTTVKRAPVARIPVTERGEQTQTALNYFGYDAGAVDGQIGPGTRAAIERYQVSMGYPVDGRNFTDNQFETLMAAYYWADNGGQQQTGLYGQQLLMAYKNQVAGAPVMAGAGAPALGGQEQMATDAAASGGEAGSIFAPAPSQPDTTQTTLAAGGAAAAPPLLGGAPQLQPQAETKSLAAAPVGGLPNFLATGEAKSLASHCNTVSLLTGSNGGFTKANAVTDPDFALSEQFCLARTYAIETGQELAAAVQGVSASQIEAQCGAFGTALASQVYSLGTKGRDAVLLDVSSFVTGSGVQPADLAGTARICLGVGYRTDDMKVALGSALVLAAVGERAYGELMGHHLSQGFGAAVSETQARPWYEMGIEAAEAKALFAPGQPERVEVIRAAMNGGTSAAGPAVVPASAGTTLPTFTVAE